MQTLCEARTRGMIPVAIEKVGKAQAELLEPGPAAECTGKEKAGRQAADALEQDSSVLGSWNAGAEHRVIASEFLFPMLVGSDLPGKRMNTRTGHRQIA